MNQLLLTLGALTLGGSAAVVLLALAGRSTRQLYGAKWRCWVWLLLCLRLAVPLSLPRWSQTCAPIQVEVPAAPSSPPALPAPVSPDAGSPPSPGSQTAPDGSSSPPLNPAPAPNRLPSLPQVLLAVWLTGAAVMVAWNLRAHLLFLRYLRRWSAPVANEEALQAFHQLGDQLKLRRRPRLLTCKGLQVPMLAGALHPALLLPQEALSGERLGFSLLHELTHFRRRDIWLKALALWVNALHWFNPFMWYMVRLLDRDTELACDEDALRTLPPEACAAYGQTILDAVAGLQGRHK